MSVETPQESALMEQMFSARPSLLTRYKDFYAAVWEQDHVPRKVLELCRLRIAAIHGCEAEQHVRDREVHISSAEAKALATGEISPYEKAEQAALALAEKMPFNHHGITDAEVFAVERSFGAPGAVTLLTALSLFDATCRWKLTLGAQAEPQSLADPPLSKGSLV